LAIAAKSSDNIWRHDGESPMSTHDDPLIQKLIEKLRDVDPRTRRNAAGALRMLGQRAAIAASALAALLADDNPMVRQEAQRALDHLRMAGV